MLFRWPRKRHAPSTGDDTATTSSQPPLNAVDAAADDAHIRIRAEQIAREIAQAWNALSEADREELEAAYAEQTALREEYGIKNFRPCRRGGVSASALPDAETVRSETQMLRAMVTSADLPRVTDPQPTSARPAS